MIDFVKIAIRSPTLAKWLVENKSFDFLVKVNEESGEVISFPKTAQYNSLEITIHESHRVEVRGSLHKFWNKIKGIDDQRNKGVNWNDFTFADLCECIRYLSEKLNLNPQEARLENVEFGVNVSPPFNPTTFYRNVIAFKDESPGKLGKVYPLGIDFYKQQYGFKIYDKGKQYGRENILRIEVKATRMEFLKETKILYLSDLTDIEKLRSLSVLLSETFEELVIDDKINTKQLNRNERRIYELCKNSKMWEEFTAKQRCIYKKKFSEIVERYGQHQWRPLTAQLIKEKCNELLKSGNELTNLIEINKECSNSSNSVLLPSLTDKRYCLTCGRDITTQKTGSKFCSEKMYGREAKKCRNIDSNPRNHFRYKIERIEQKGTLFNVRPFFVFCR